MSAEYCEYMWNPTTRGHSGLALARSLYQDENRIDPRDKKLAVKTVRAILTDMPNVDLKQCTDEYVTRFLFARKYRTEQAAALIVAYQNQVALRQDIFGNLTARDPALQRALRAGIPGVLPARDRKGRCVLVILASQWDPIAVPALAVQRALFLVLEILIQDPRNQHSGFVAVVDWAGFSLRQGGALGATALRNLISALRGRFPARFKAIHFLSSPLCVQATLAVIKPFLDEKTRNKIYLHGNNLTTLHEHLPTDILPAELGGTGPAFNPGLWAEPVIHSAMKEAEIAAAVAQKERDLRARDLVAMMQSKNGKVEPKPSATIEFTEISATAKTDNKTGRNNRAESTKDCFHQVQAQLHERPGSEEKITPNIRSKTNSIASSDIKNSSDYDRERLLNGDDENKILEIESTQNEEPRGYGEVNEQGSRPLSSVDIEVQKFREYQNKLAEEKNIRSDPDGLPDDIEALELHSETNSNEFEMIPSRPDSESSKDSSFDIDLQVEKVIIRDGGKSAAPSEELSLVT
ncbi:clavesin-2-like [Athalia rosae]|uniref:clavesin-2-like n=1 Tax=Athalia rosae TaxID=37344 RepID=UPI0020333CE4|nr:clavesin-2-like [Athalia rosae]XP_012263347.2 clavesin-2-like [Athalia rosae]XP_012263350.2 clavesin-2-like [Athalia rosae]XP_012263351.2 clavesin-2-like [Athalia rosae]XP_012263352.2 clavesin-2-like [Athalia rosae]XP_020710452.2 clavesin-2-like [Athalia rosae]XP_020710453.2 clavesin-2-like [Athalia rosae]XP_020710455.2 clavesin-2-like [Athalia rosae]XP_020710456.2 clavesin-2-like [Athalia rosae]XP_048510885.1 clavesin-2-like [Athalia rosae]XP_048510886.1 clavesin-2-like [Athalia rosae